MKKAAAQLITQRGHYSSICLNHLIHKGCKSAQISFKKVGLFLYKSPFISWDLQGWIIFSQLNRARRGNISLVVAHFVFCVSGPSWACIVYCEWLVILIAFHVWVVGLELQNVLQAILHDKEKKSKRVRIKSVKCHISSYKKKV